MKSLGIGIGLSLNRLECRVSSAISKSAVVCDTEIWIDGDVDATASFEESLLDDMHLVVVCLKQVCTLETWKRIRLNFCCVVFLNSLLCISNL